MRTRLASHRSCRGDSNPVGGLLAALLAVAGAWAVISPGHAAAKPLVVAGDGILCDLTRTLAADQATVACLLPPGADPHQAALKPSDRRALAEARLVLITGYGLTPALERLTRGSAAVSVSVAERAVPENPGRDPHLWHDPGQAAAMLRVVETSLLGVLPASAAPGVKRRTQEGRAVLADLARWTEVQIDTVPPANRVLVSEHRAFSSLARRFGVRELPLLDVTTTGGVLRPASLAAMTKAIRASGARQLFPESLPPSKTLRRISRDSGVPVSPTPLVADGLGPGRSAVQTATGNVCTFVNGQGGRCDTTGAERLARRWASIP
ncbi:MAG: zinc ABC transporter substrate-binding protein [Cyanobacteria bacterium K_Offshore_surface_m2_239]|nr:zinc ABC transporter substrate-binding protein [Cyanobacteria bacterium K_Offshore_surface_m2_239]